MLHITFGVKKDGDQNEYKVELVLHLHISLSVDEIFMFVYI